MDNIIKFLSIALSIIISINAQAINPTKGHQSNPDSLQLGLKWSEHFIWTVDSSEVCVWHIEAASDKKKNTTIILSYGDAGNMSKWLMHVAPLALEGYDVYCYDYRGFGKSGYIYNEPLALYYDEYVKDLSRVVAFARQRHPQHRLGMLSYSMGTIVSNIYLYEHTVDFAIYDGYIHNPVSVSNRAYDSKKVILELPPSAYGYEHKSKNLKLPMLFFVGENDEISLPFFTKNFAAKRKNRKVITSEAGHLENFIVLSNKGAIGDIYMKHIFDFIREL